MKKRIITFGFVFIIGFMIGIGSMYFFMQSVQKEKSLSYYAMGNERLGKNVDDALLMFFYSSSLKPNWYAPHLGLAQCFEKKKIYSLAISEYEKAILLREKSTIASFENNKILQKIKELRNSEKGVREKFGEQKGLE